MHKRIITSIVLSAITISAHLHATELVVLADAGGTPIEKFIDPNILDQLSAERRLADVKAIEQQAAITRAENEDPDLVKAKVLNSMFPIESYALSPIHLTADITRPNNNVANPIAVIGDDESSKKWVASNAEYLKANNIILAIVEAKNENGIYYYKRLYPSLKVMIQVGDELNKEFGVPGYPVLLTNQGIYQ
ncbi:hypothetical protein A1QO_02835 [Vibrio genomosp. F10 str. ZF-129]|uniref:Integrating conjugative element protein n=1 Tax=Vibrio genomosp. F10 str. ZF-129 TaxID=1187848 RepID=A0A1E5BKE9_9VIBR|nr:DUF2859 domain-containing protein [Vibrio genomosp. F10]OEE38332.1 hypothetical protein A1QO_02835 [Vibrio genomosp. F10 str. ZF-129]